MNREKKFTSEMTQLSQKTLRSIDEIAYKYNLDSLSLLRVFITQFNKLIESEEKIRYGEKE